MADQTLPDKTSIAVVLDTDQVYRINAAGTVEGRSPVSAVRDPSKTILAAPFTPANAVIVALDSVKIAFQKAQGQINNLLSTAHAAVTLNADSKTQDALGLAGQEIQIKEDVYDKANETGIEQIQGSTILTPPSLSSNQDNYNPTNFATANMIRLDVTSDIDISGFLAPPAGINRIISLNNVTTNGKKIKLLHNDSGSLAANRILNRKEGDKTLEPNDGGSLWYDHTDSRWRPYTRIG